MVSKASPVAEQADGIFDNQVLKFTVADGATPATNIAVSTTDTSGEVLLVFWLDVTP